MQNIRVLCLLATMAVVSAAPGKNEPLCKVWIPWPSDIVRMSAINIVDCWGQMGWDFFYGIWALIIVSALGDLFHAGVLRLTGTPRKREVVAVEIVEPTDDDTPDEIIIPDSPDKIENPSDPPNQVTPDSTNSTDEVANINDPPNEVTPDSTDEIENPNDPKTEITPDSTNSADEITTAPTDPPDES